MRQGDRADDRQSQARAAAAVASAPLTVTASSDGSTRTLANTPEALAGFAARLDATCLVVCERCFRNLKQAYPVTSTPLFTAPPPASLDARPIGTSRMSRWPQPSQRRTPALIVRPQDGQGNAAVLTSPSAAGSTGWGFMTRPPSPAS